jgi:hypothetical protein
MKKNVKIIVLILVIIAIVGGVIGLVGCTGAAKGKTGPGSAQSGTTVNVITPYADSYVNLTTPNGTYEYRGPNPLPQKDSFDSSYKPQKTIGVVQSYAAPPDDSFYRVDLPDGSYGWAQK